MRTPPLSDRPQRLAANLSKLWERRLLPRPDLASLVAEAAAVDARLGRSAGGWRGVFERLIDDLLGPARLNALGISSAYVQLKGLLTQRERAYQLWEDHRSITSMSIEKPVIILGHMRSGTTRLQRLLGCDPRFNHTRFYEVMDPVPRRGPDLRVVKSWAQLRMLNALNPALDAVHPASATGVEEVFGLFSFSFYGAQIEAQWRVPGFARYWEGAERPWVYREFLQLLRTIAWARGADARPWVLKAPQFMEDLDLVLAAFPDARLICLHRDAAAVVGSSASLVWNQMRIQSDEVDKAWIGREWLHKTARRARICCEVRKANPHVPQVDVTFEDMNRDWLGQMRRIYGFLGLELTPEVERRMRTYLREAERSGFRSHSYGLEDFGLDATKVRNLVGPSSADPI